MCTYRTVTLAVEGSGKGPGAWFPVTDATVYVDHPVHAAALHTVNIDLRNPARGAAARVALELDPAAAARLAHAILDALAAAPDDIMGSVPAPGARATVAPAEQRGIAQP